MIWEKDTGEFSAGKFSSGEYSVGQFTTGELDEGDFSSGEFYERKFPVGEFSGHCSENCHMDILTIALEEHLPKILLWIYL